MVKKLSELFDNVEKDTLIKGIKTNSKDITEGDLFVCIKGKVDRHEYIPEAIKNKASALVVSKKGDYPIPYILVDDPDSIIDDLYIKFYDNPLKDLKIIGVTGTDGKTSTSTIIQALLGNDICGYIGTNGYSCKAFNRETDNTTPGKETLYRIFYEFKQAGCKYVAMEASSEGFFYNRLDHIQFAASGITNIDSEHLNTHKTLSNYIDCKKNLFRQTINNSILNSHDKHFSDVLDSVNNYFTYGYNQNDDLFIKNIECFPNMSIYTYVYKNNEYQVKTKLLGTFNAENLACALLILISMGNDISSLIKNVDKINVPGRMDYIEEGQDFYCIVDYAHTPNGLTRLYEYVKLLNINKVISVSGQAGERDPYKRKHVGKIISDNSDIAIFTYEDPRHEDINKIIDNMVELIENKNYLRIIDRHQAIEKAIELANKDDLVLVLGKGSENYELIGDDCIYFDDEEECRKAIRLKNSRHYVVSP